MTETKMNEILELHKKWLNGAAAGDAEGGRNKTMTIDEIKQALRETKDICAFNRTCTTCPLGIDSRGSKICPMRYWHPDFVRPFDWPLDWPENEDDTKRSTHREE